MPGKEQRQPEGAQLSPEARLWHQAAPGSWQEHCKGQWLRQCPLKTPNDSSDSAPGGLCWWPFLDSWVWGGGAAPESAPPGPEPV